MFACEPDSNQGAQSNEWMFKHIQIKQTHLSLYDKYGKFSTIVTACTSHLLHWKAMQYQGTVLWKNIMLWIKWKLHLTLKICTLKNVIIYSFLLVSHLHVFYWSLLHHNLYSPITNRVFLISKILYLIWCCQQVKCNCWLIII